MTTVREVMSAQLVTVAASAYVAEAAQAMSLGHAGSALVLEEGVLAGIFTERDIMRALGESSSADLARVSSVAQWMTRDPDVTGPDATVGEALDRMISGGFRHLPVVEDGVPIGIVSMRDLAKSIARE